MLSTFQTILNFSYRNQNKMEEIKKLKEEQEKMLKKNKNRKEEREMDRKLEKLEGELEEWMHEDE